MKRTDFNKHISSGNFKELFITEMGWNSSKGTITLPLIDEVEYKMQIVAERNGFQVLTCNVASIPSHSLCRKIDGKLQKQANDYICIFITDGEHHQWVVPVKTVEKRDLVTIEYLSAKQADFLFSKMEDISFDLDEETTIVDVKSRVQGAFMVNSEKITKDFYTGFRKEHKAFTTFIEGVEVEADRQWYASVMLNRLMFCYFIQKKGFLNLDTNYLQNQLAKCKQKRGQDKFFSTFYKSFLCQLFHDGLNAPKHDAKFEAKYGRIPYLNGGMFEEHQIEKRYKDLDIKDDAFERLFAFFDKWEWHLDTRITATGKDINPDVLGYIFEQYINDRAQMGAYYTKEDITEYIGKNCIIPYLMDQVEKTSSSKDFKTTGYVWETLKNSGDTYIYDAVKKGVEKPLPDYIEEGIDTTKPNLIERRSRWNEKSFDELALPTEIWRETVERRQRYTSILNKIECGEISHINDFITYNLDIRQFAYDLLKQTQDHLYVEHFYHALQHVTVLDPTCGSGAFLFAALNILEPLYDVCIDRMEEFHQQNPKLFVKELDELNNKYRSNRQYFIYKSIILRNLYGVDIMVEATEVAKLRLFLKMVAVVEVDRRAENLGLDPLPDIDFNIRCGNTLVGYATEEQLQHDLLYGDMIANVEFKQKIDLEMDKVARTYEVFKDVQLNQAEDLESFKRAKGELRERLVKLNDLLNRRLHMSTAEIKPYSQWLEDAKPFHWLAEFYQIMHEKGGFSVIIGNPPYVVYNPKTFAYVVSGYKTEQCADLYAYVIERSLDIISENISLGMIVPVSIISTDGFSSLRNHIRTKNSTQWYSSYAIRPAKLFDGAEKRLTIITLRKGSENRIFTTRFHRWYAEERSSLLYGLRYEMIHDNCLYLSAIPKLGNDVSLSIWRKLITQTPMSMSFVKNSPYTIFHTRKVGYYLQFLDRPPLIYNEDGSIRESSELKKICLNSEIERYASISLFLSTTFFWFFNVLSDCRNLNKREIDNFCFSIPKAKKDTLSKLANYGNELLCDLQDKSYFQIVSYKKYGNLSLQIFQPKSTIPITEKIDHILGQHYGFTEEELDFITNYDIKYRMGDELKEE